MSIQERYAAGLAEWTREVERERWGYGGDHGSVVLEELSKAGQGADLEQGLVAALAYWTNKALGDAYTGYSGGAAPVIKRALAEIVG